MRRQKKPIVVLILALFISFTFINIFSRCTCGLVQPVKSSHPCCQAEGKDCCKTQKCTHISSDLAINKQEVDNSYQISSCMPFFVTTYEIPTLVNNCFLISSTHDLSPPVKLYSLYCAYLC